MNNSVRGFVQSNLFKKNKKKTKTLTLVFVCFFKKITSQDGSWQKDKEMLSHAAKGGAQRTPHKKK